MKQNGKWTRPSKDSKVPRVLLFIRPLMQAIVSLGLLGPSVYVIMSGGANQQWAIGVVGLVVGYWLKR
jgi:hypothetical protein